MTARRVNVSTVKAIGDRDHMLGQGDMYLPSATTETIDSIFLTRTCTLEKRTCKINQALVHIPNEYMSNAGDNAAKNGHVSQFQSVISAMKTREEVEDACRISDARVEVTLTPKRMSVVNYGAPFDIDYLEKEGVQYLIPYACFTMTKVSSNFDYDLVPCIGIGRYGVGAKSGTNCSKEFNLVCVDAIRKRFYSLKLYNNGDLSTRVEQVWPVPQKGADGKLFIPESTMKVPEDLVDVFAAGSCTLIDWIPDYEEGEMTEEQIKEFLAKSSVGDRVLVRGIHADEYVGRLDSTASVIIDGRTYSRIIHLKNVTCDFTVPSTKLFFKGAKFINDDEIDFVGKLALDLSVCGIPFILNRTWNDGTSAEHVLIPITPLEYGKLFYGRDKMTFDFLWRSKDNKDPVACDVAYFDAPNAGIQFGFVNGLFTTSGIHIEAAIKAVLGPMEKNPMIQKYAPDADARDFKKHVGIVISCMGLNPKQKGQTKEGLIEISRRKSFTIAPLDDSDMNSLVKNWEAFAVIMAAGRAKEIGSLKASVNKELIDAYVPANVQGPDSILFLAEGDSCMPYANIVKNQLGIEEQIGILSMRGVPPNLFQKDAVVIYGNKLFRSIVKYTNLDPLLEYSTEQELATLNYGKILFVGDPDLDGFHIVALMLANFVKHWPFLFKQRRIAAFRTPVVKIFNPSGTKVLARYYSDKEYEDAMQVGAVPKGESKRFKGLGSVKCGDLDSPDIELLDDVQNAPVMWFKMDSRGYGMISDFFSSGLAAKRREHMLSMSKTCNVFDGEMNASDETKMISIGGGGLLQRNVESYVCKELVQYSMGSILRQIPGARDCLKDVQRKIVAWWLQSNNFGKNSTTRKVEQLNGSISGKMDYHHGQASMGSAIKGMAICGFPGANNLPFFKRQSGMGSRLNWPDDCPQDRYAFVGGADWLKYAFHKFIYDAVPRKMNDGEELEPEWIPCDIPFSLMNGIYGISTGWRSYVPNCHPRSVVNYLLELATAHSENRKPALKPVIFWYCGFTGTVEFVKNQKIVATADDIDETAVENVAERAIRLRGIYGLYDPPRGSKACRMIMKITEIPPENRLLEMNKTIEKLKQDGFITACKHSTKNGVSYELHLTETGVSLARSGELEKILSLVTTSPLTLMNFLDETGFPKKFASVEEYLNYFYSNAIKDYKNGITLKISRLEQELLLLEKKSKYIRACMNNTIVLGQMTEDQIDAVLQRLGIETKLADEVPSRSICQQGLDRNEALVGKKTAEITELRSLRPEVLYKNNLEIFLDKVKLDPLPHEISAGKWSGM